MDFAAGFNKKARNHKGLQAAEVGGQKSKIRNEDGMPGTLNSQILRLQRRHSLEFLIIYLIGRSLGQRLKATEQVGNHI